LKYVKALLLSGLKGHREPMVYVVLTAPGGVDVATWNAGAPARLTAFVRGIRRAMGGRVSYFYTAEIQDGKRRRDGQARGAIHYNLVLRGTRYVPLATWNRVAASAGFGTNALHPRLVRPSKSRSVGARTSLGGLAWYATKLLGYVLKDAPGWNVRARVYGHSRDWPLPPDPSIGRRGWRGPEMVCVPLDAASPADGSLRRAYLGSRRELVAAGVLPRSEWGYVQSEIEAYRALARGFREEHARLAGLLTRLEAVRAAGGAPVAV